MIELAPDMQREPQVKRALKLFWFVSAATALPLADFLRSGSSLSLLGGLLGFGFICTLVVTNLYILRVGPQLLGYEERFHDLYIQTALKTYRLPVASLYQISLMNGRDLQYRSGISIQNYHVGWFHLPEVGMVQVAASTLAGPGLLIMHRGGLFSPRRRHIYLSPAEPEAVQLVLEDLMAEARWRVALGQP